MVTDADREWAIQRIREKRAFWIHFGVYLTVNAFLVAVWAVTSRGYFWPIWSILGWGLGVGVHGAVVFLGGGTITEERIQRELGRRG